MCQGLMVSQAMSLNIDNAELETCIHSKVWLPPKKKHRLNPFPRSLLQTSLFWYI